MDLMTEAPPCPHQPTGAHTTSPGTFSPSLSLPPNLPLPMQIPGEGGHLPVPPPPTSCPARVWWGWSHTRTRSRRAAVVTAAAASPLRLPHCLPTTLRLQAEGTPDMPLCLSPSRLDGPHFSCLVSQSPGDQGG